MAETKKYASLESLQTFKTNADNLYATKVALDDKADTGHGHAVSEISDLTATAAELNYMNGVTSGVQAQIDGKMNSVDPVSSGSFSMGRKADTTVGENSVAIGYDVTASGISSHAEGFDTESSGNAAHAEGLSTTASGNYSHAEGTETTASVNAAHAEGSGTTASGDSSHAEGGYTTASGNSSHAEGWNTIASGISSHAEGWNTEALAYQHVQGHYNKTSNAPAGSNSGTTGNAFIIGNGTNSAPANAFRVPYNGKPYALGTITTSGADYAEFFEWQDSNPTNEDRRGYFVTLDGNKIKIAEPNDWILGIISALPAVIGNGDEDWRGRYILDDFGAFITEEFEYEEEILNKETSKKEIVKKTGTKYKENPNYDSSLDYIQRENRPEWDAVGMMGVLAVRDDGTCQVNEFCKVAEGGIATASESGYRVIERVSENIVKVVFR